MKKILSTKACMAGIMAAVLFALFALTTATSAPVVVVPGEGAGYIYYGASAGTAPAVTPVADDSNVGMVAAFFFTPPVDTWVVCEGQTIYAAAYPKLVKALTGSNSATSAVMPDLRGEFLRGLDSGRGVDPEAGTRGGVGSAQAARTGSAGLEDFMERRTPYAYGTLSMSVFAPKMGVHPNYGGTTNSYRGDLIPSDIGETRPRNIAVIYAMRAK